MYIYIYKLPSKCILCKFDLVADDKISLIMNDVIFLALAQLISVSIMWICSTSN